MESLRCVDEVKARILSVSFRRGHGLGKTVTLFATLIEGQGVSGDAHCGVTVKHRSRAAKNPALPNVRQVHLLHSELLDELTGKGFAVAPGELGENLLTRGLDLLGLPLGTILSLPSGARIELTGLRNPCTQLNGHSPGLMNAMIDRADDGALIRKGGVMGIVITGGDVQAGDSIQVTLPPGPHMALQPV
jgi:MOSC domain-containing protein YiiM